MGNVRVSYSDLDKNGILGDETIVSCSEPDPITGIQNCIFYFTSSILEENHYYPFGLEHKGYDYSNSQVNYQYKYNGKEWQDELGLNVYDMSARNYMPDIGRWGVIDELGELFYDQSPYAFANNNPAIFSDPSGLAPESSAEEEKFSSSEQNFASTFVNGKGKIVEHRDDGDTNIYLVGDSWKPGGSKSGLAVLGFEKEGEEYKKGRNVFFEFDTGYGIIFGDGQRRASGAAKPIGGAFDIFGFWEAFGTMTEDNPELAWATFLLTKGKKGKIPCSEAS